MSRLRVQHCVLAATVSQSGPNPTSNLLGVDYYPLTLAPDVEFPRAIGRIDLFVRFFPRKLGPTPIAVRVYWEAPAGGRRSRVGDYRFQLPFTPTVRVLDRVFRLVNVHLPGRGLYSVRVCWKRTHPWRRVPVWQRLASEWFEVR